MTIKKNGQGYRKETETQATTDPVPEDFDSSIAPQGYDPDLVEEIADMETAHQKRRKAIWYLIWTVVIMAAATFFCLPLDEEPPPDVPIPYNLEARPQPASDLFLRQIAPKQIGDFKLVHQQEERLFRDPFVGADVAMATYIRESDSAAGTIWIIDTGSYINANRYLTGLKSQLMEEDRVPQLVDRIWLQHSFLHWEAPSLDNRAYGFAWSNERYFFQVVSATQETRDYLVENFPY
jgi:hypothetical protein